MAGCVALAGGTACRRCSVILQRVEVEVVIGFEEKSWEFRY